MNKNTKPSQPYTKQSLGTWANIRIRARLFFVFVRKAFNANRMQKPVLAAGLIFAILVLFIAPQGLTSYRVRGFVAKAEAAQLEIIQRSESEILHRTFIVAEGTGKSAFVAKKTNIPLEEISDVPLRRDTVEEWRSGITNLSYIKTDVLGRPIQVKLNLENKDHMHIFEYAPRSCVAQERDGISTPECERKKDATTEYTKYRSEFDKVHDITSLYEKQIAYNPEPEAITNFQALTHVGRIEENNTFYEVFSSFDTGIETQYYFNTKTYLLKKRVITVIDGSDRYEMSVIDEVDQSFLSADEKTEIFNPKKYSFVQKEVIPLKTGTDI